MSPPRWDPQVVGSYRLGHDRHRIEVIVRRGARLLVDRPLDGGHVGVIAELDRDDGERQVLAVLHDAGYLRRAASGERGLCRPLDDVLAEHRAA